MKMMNNYSRFLLCAVGFLLISARLCAHEKHIGTLSVKADKDKNSTELQIKLHLPDYEACSKSTEDGLLAWVNGLLTLSIDGEKISFSTATVTYQHDIIINLVLNNTCMKQLSIHSDMLYECYPSQKLVVVVDNCGKASGTVLQSSQRDFVLK